MANRSEQRAPEAQSGSTVRGCSVQEDDDHYSKPSPSFSSQLFFLHLRLYFLSPLLHFVRSTIRRHFRSQRTLSHPPSLSPSLSSSLSILHSTLLTTDLSSIVYISASAPPPLLSKKPYLVPHTAYIHTHSHTNDFSLENEELVQKHKKAAEETDYLNHFIILSIHRIPCNLNRIPSFLGILSKLCSPFCKLFVLFFLLLFLLFFLDCCRTNQ